MSVSVKQLLLLNNLMYLDPADGPYPDYAVFEGMKVKDLIDAVDISKIVDEDPEHPRMTSAEEWRKFITAIRKDMFVMNMTILCVYTDLSEEGGGCRSAVFISPDEKDAVVVFKGTELVVGSLQWKDNFYSGNVTDTPHQINALRWYRRSYGKYQLHNYTVTLTGHSKGGNKAKYIAILDDTPDHCVSFDGEGFSDKFFRKYGIQIRRRADRIENHIVNYDYISLLLNDIGTCTYYLGNNYGTGGFTENHLANTFMKFRDDGDFEMIVDENGKPAEMMALDEFANSYLRSLYDEERSLALAMLNELLNAVLTLKRTMTRTEIVETFLDLAQNEDNSRNISYFLAYLIRYEQKYPSVTELLGSVFRKFDLDALVQYVDLVAGIINWKKRILWVSLDFDRLAAAIRHLNMKAPGWVYQRLSSYLEKINIYLTRDQIGRLADIVEMTDSFLKTVAICEDGTDRSV